MLVWFDLLPLCSMMNVSWAWSCSREGGIKCCFFGSLTSGKCWWKGLIFILVFNRLLRVLGSWTTVLLEDFRSKMSPLWMQSNHFTQFMYANIKILESETYFYTYSEEFWKWMHLLFWNVIVQKCENFSVYLTYCQIIYKCNHWGKRNPSSFLENIIHRAILLI